MMGVYEVPTSEERFACVAGAWLGIAFYVWHGMPGLIF